VLRLITLGRLQLVRDGPTNEPIHLQPKRLALLAFLALAAGDGCQQRDTLLALFWPRSDREHSRRCLRQALFHLRNELGDGVILNRGRDGLALAPGRLWCDAAAVEAALREHRRREAIDLYSGDFLPGLYVDRDGAELDEWVERTRRALRGAVAACAWELADEEERHQRIGSALELAHRARGLSPDDEQGLRRHMALLARAGDSAAALGAYADFSRRLRREYGAEPSSESLALVDTLKQGGLVRRWSGAAWARADGTEPPSHPRTWPRRRTSMRRRLSRLTAFTLTLAAGLMLTGTLARSPVGQTAGRLVLAEFSNHTRDSLLGVAVTEAVRAELSKIARVDLAGARAVQPASPAVPLAPGQVLILVTGDVAPAGSGFAVSAQLVAAGSGRVLGVLQEEAADTQALLSTVRRLSHRLQGNVIQSLKSPEETGALDESGGSWLVGASRTGGPGNLRHESH
jgi:DNA-binding SARP family transcriptional activator